MTEMVWSREYDIGVKSSIASSGRLEMALIGYLIKQTLHFSDMK